MTEIEWTPKALELLEGLETEPQERLVKKLDEAKYSTCQPTSNELDWLPILQTCWRIDYPAISK